jgi:putative flippase GtrA
MYIDILRKHTLMRIVRFQCVGLGGTLLNFSCLWLLHGMLHMHLLIAGAVAIELAIIHNFTWHYLQTWKNRVLGTYKDYCTRLFKYNMITAAVDLYLNLGILYLLATHMSLHYMAANLLAMSVGFLVKFILNDHIIFKKEHPLTEPRGK